MTLLPRSDHPIRYGECVKMLMVLTLCPMVIVLWGGGEGAICSQPLPLKEYIKNTTTTKMTDKKPTRNPI
jgi:hypothetical protein